MGNTNVITYGLAFLEGLALIVSPCILPILPIMLSGSIEGGKKRPFGIILGFIITFALFTLFARNLVQILGINLDIIRVIAFGLLILFGFILISDRLSAEFSHITQRLANFGNQISTTVESSLAKRSNDANSGGFIGGLLLGLLISLIWVPCAGPILAAAIVQTAIQKTSWQSFFTFFSFALGSMLPMMLIALLGRSLVNKLSFLKTHTETLKKVFGVIIVLGAGTAAWMSFAPLSLPTATLASEKSSLIKNKETFANKLIGGCLMSPYPAPAFQNEGTWLNSAPLSTKKVKGKVVLIDFWTYSCINCIRTLPYLIKWYEKYHRYGFEIVGIHTPEFEFEKNTGNVIQAIKKFNIPYPVLLDNDHTTWQNYNNQFWPAHYLIDTAGNVVYQHFGEGNYDETERNIRKLL